MDKRSKWIWTQAEEAADQYADFVDEFAWAGGALSLKISADSNYAVWLNGQYVYSGQYPDFPHYKVFDELDLSSVARPGNNRLAVTVWHYGKGNMGYFPGRAALRYELWSGQELLRASGADTLSRLSPDYVQGLQKTITGQLGFSFKADLTRGDDWRAQGAGDFAPARVVEQDLPMFLRPQKICKVGSAAQSACIQNHQDTHFLYDLGKEHAGFLTLEIDSAEEQDVLIAYGEHIVDGKVRRFIGSRDFSVELKLKKGRNVYMNPFRRLGLRYLELFGSEKMKIGLLSVLPVEYPLDETKNLPPMDEGQKRIYDTCVRTLKMCMHEHYEDTPWREQALYAMDSRNQILCGYHAFGEFAFPRANLLLMSKDERRDGLLSICTPSSDDLTIPSFSLHYFTEVEEYTRISGDLTLAQEVFPKLRRVLSAFTQRLEDGLIPVFTEKCHWNFYEWSEGLSGTLFRAEGRRFDTALNCLLVMALENMAKIARAIGETDEYSALAETIRRAVYVRFYDARRAEFVNGSEDERASELVNALGVLCGAVQGEEAAALAAKLAGGENGMTPATLSMLCFKYDALLQADKEKYAVWVLEDIARKYQRMLSAGATTFWETEQGEGDFGDAGSLCHGWSAMPVYYYHILLGDGACASKN